jgi:tetratricopeptide (TPR) repeat protein
VAVTTFIAFVPSLSAGFVAWDDQTNFLENPHYRGLAWQNLHWMWSNFLLGHFVPLSWMTLGLDFVVWGMNPFGYHLTNVALHTGNAVLMYFLARRILIASNLPAATAEGPALAIVAGFAALFFSVHPLRVESVAWVTERRDVLSALFYLTCLLCYLRFTDNDGRDRKWYWRSLLAFVCALLSKGTSVTVPVVLLVMNVYPLRRLTTDWRSPGVKRVVRELMPFVVLAFAFVVMTFVALQSMPQLSVPKKAAVSAYSLAFYLWKTIAPTGLAPLYDMPPDIDPLGGVYLAGYFVAIAGSVVAWRARKKRPGISAAWVLFVLILLPLLGVHQNGPQIAADRYTYNAAPVLAILLAAGWLSLKRPLAALPVAAAVASILVLGGLTWQQNRIWHDSVTMWSAVLRLNDRSSITLTGLGNLETKAGRPDSAAMYFKRSLQVDPDSPEAENNLGIALSQLGQLAEARGHFERALQLKAGYYEAENNLGLAIAGMGGAPETSIDHYRRALSIKPDFPDAHVNWGNALIAQGKLSEAIPHYQQALAIQPEDADAHRNWGVALARQNRLDEAIAHFRRALELRPGWSDVQHLLKHAVDLRSGGL